MVKYQRNILRIDHALDKILGNNEELHFSILEEMRIFLLGCMYGVGYEGLHSSLFCSSLVHWDLHTYLYQWECGKYIADGHKWCNLRSVWSARSMVSAHEP
jgi:hypothetical protein